MPLWRTLRIGDLAVFRFLVHDLDEVFAPLFVERRNREPDVRAVDVGREAEVAGLDRLADRADGERSNAVICSVRASGVLTLATCLSGTDEP
jgi:hypothetical protein